MRTTQIRKQLHDYIDAAENKKLKAIYTLLEDDISEGHNLTDAQKQELDQRFNDHKNGMGRTYTLDETIEMAKQSLINNGVKK